MRAWAKLGSLTVLVLFCVCSTSAWARHRRAKRPAIRHAGEAFVAKVATRKVVPGDTLWRLTGEVTGKPWVWPQIWALNPSLSNPHWLVVGQTIHFTPNHSGRGLHVASFMPAPQQLQSIDADGAAEQSPLHAAGAQPLPANATPRGAAAVGANVQLAAPATAVAANAAAPALQCLPAMILPRAKTAELARIAVGSAEGLMWRQGDSFVVQWPEHAPRKPGPWAVIRLPAEDDDPAAGGKNGVMVTCTGIAEAIDDDEAHRPQGRLLALRQEVEAGQYLLPLAQMQSMNAAADTQPTRAAPVCSKVLSVEQGALAGSPLHFIFLNAGATQGLQPGTRLRGQKSAAHAHDDAELLVVQSSEDASTARVLRARREVSVGQVFCVAAGGTP